MYTLGVWDGHDSGAALVEDGNVVFAANEERFTKRKLEVKFPSNSIMAALGHAGLKPTDVENVAFTTTEFTKTLERLLPFMKENYYTFRRRKMLRPRFENLRHNLKYAMTSIGMLPGTAAASRSIVARQLRAMGFSGFKLDVVEHHDAHAATAAFTSGMPRALVITLDGVGDGLCGSVGILNKGSLQRKQSIGVRDSIGIFYEQVTNLLGMRELEDEGKVMAMSCYSYPFQYSENQLKDFFSVSGTSIRAKYGPMAQYGMLQRIAWSMPREQFAYMAQQLLEHILGEFAANCLDAYGMRDLVLAGGIFANVKANMVIRNLDGLRHWYVFPHMGDGGIALGSALYSSYSRTGRSSYGFGAYLGSGYTQDETEQAVRRDKSLQYERETPNDQASHAAELIAKGEYMLWFQGRMEFGPRALGNRSIIARSDSEEVKDRLNMYVKKREWFQPFCPSILEEDVPSVLEYDGKGYDRYMTMAYLVRRGMLASTVSVRHIDGSARPQMVGSENPLYAQLLKKVRRKSGTGIIMNTSFNIHGQPIVMDPKDALETLKATRTRHMFINGLFITNKGGV